MTKTTEEIITLEQLNALYPEFTKEQLKKAHEKCKEYRLTPLKKQIHFQLNNSRVKNEWIKVLVDFPTVNGLRTLAERTGEYAGQDGAFWCGQDGVWKDVWLEKGYPSAAKVGIYRKGFVSPLYGVAKFDEFKQVKRDGKIGSIWAKMPDLMIAKCAEALALRRAFPEALEGLYTKEEMEQAGNPKTVDCAIAEATIMTDIDQDTLNDLIETAIKSLKDCKHYTDLNKVWKPYVKKQKVFSDDDYKKICEVKDEVVKQLFSSKEQRIFTDEILGQLVGCMETKQITKIINDNIGLISILDDVLKEEIRIAKDQYKEDIQYAKQKA